MRNLIRLTLAATVGALAAPAFADSGTIAVTPEAVAAHRAAAAADAASRNQRIRATIPSAAGASPAKAATASTYPGTPLANPFRTYPPSCAADPLPDAVSGPYYSVNVPLWSKNRNTGADVGVETATLTVWRLACSSSGALTPYNVDGEGNALTLMRIERAGNANANNYVLFPRITVGQGNDQSHDVFYSRLRAATEPNTVISDIPFDAAIADAATYVLENYPYVDFGTYYFNYAFTLRIDPVVNNVRSVDLQVPDYAPTQSTYPDAFNPLPFDGYAAAQWVGKTRPGDGLLMQVTEQWSGQGPSATWSRQIVFDLLTRDTNGNPFWLIGSAPFDEGAIRVDADVYYLGANNAQTRWGRAVFSFNHCN
uniref:hypothetical protein n=1 Tax=Dokdonella sp. TaxID=2291710 RepID=UPI0026215061